MGCGAATYEPEPPAVEISSVYMRQMKAFFEKFKVVRNPHLY